MQTCCYLLLFQLLLPCHVGILKDVSTGSQFTTFGIIHSYSTAILCNVFHINRRDHSNTLAVLGCMCPIHVCTRGRQVQRHKSSLLQAHFKDKYPRARTAISRSILVTKPQRLGCHQGRTQQNCKNAGFTRAVPKINITPLKTPLFPAACLYCEPSGNRASLKWKRAKRAGENKHAGPAVCVSTPQHGENEDCPQCKTRR